MVLAQDQSQASQAQAVVDEQKYQKDLAQYEKDLIVWEKEKAAIEAENKKTIAAETKRRTDEKAADDKRIADFNLSEDKRIADFNLSEDKRIADLKAKDDKLVATAVSVVKADQKAKADIALKAETKRLADLAIKNEKERVRQEVITKNKEFFDSGQRFYGGKEIHHAKFAMVPTKEGEIKYYDGGKFTDSYYERAASVSGITVEQARIVSRAGRVSQSGKARDQVLRGFQDPTGGLEAQYRENRRLAAKTTASAYGAIAANKAQTDNAKLATLNAVSNGLLGKAPPTDIYGSASLVGTTVKASQGTLAEQIETARRTQRTIDLRAGNVGTATALLEPVTTNTYTSASGNISAIDLTKTFLTERGYDLNNLDAVPDSVFKPTKYTTARKQATKSEKTNTPMGDLTKLIPAQPTMYEKKKVGTAQVGATLNEYYKTVPNAELVKRTEARERLESIGRPVMSVQPQVQGPVQPTTKWQVSSGLTKTVTIPTMGGGSYSAQVPTKPMVFDTKEQAQQYIHHQNVSQGLYSIVEAPKENTKQQYADAYKALDDFSKEGYAKRMENLSSDNPQISMSRYGGYNEWTGAGAGLAKMALGAVIQIDNLATQTVAPWFSKTTGLNPQNQVPTAPLIQSSESSDQTLIPYNFEESKWKTEKEWRETQIKYMQTYGTGDYLGGIAGGYWIGTKGAGAFSPIAKKLVPTVVTVPGRTALGGVVQVTKDVSKYRLQVPPVVSMVREGVQAANPINIQRFDQAGVMLLEDGITPVKPLTVSIGYGEKSLALASKVGSSIQLGGPNIPGSRVRKVVIDPSLQPDPKRGVKMAAGNTAYEQKLAPQLIPLVEGISKAEIRKAEIIYEIQKITTSKRKDTMYRKSLPRNAFANLTNEEAVQVLEISKKAQKARNFPIGAYKGSLSQPYFVLKEYARKIGDVDVHSKDFLEGQMIIKRYEGMTPSFGREFLFNINEKNKSIQGKTQNIVKVNYVDTAEEAERLNRANIKKATNVKFVDTDAYRIEQTRKYNLPSDYFGDVREGHLFGQYQKPHNVLNQSRRRIDIPETVIIEKNAQSNYTALNPLERSKYLDATGNFDNTAWQKTVIQHELIHKANPNLTERQVRTLADGYSVDELGMTKAMKKFHFVEPKTTKVKSNVIMKEVESVPLTLPKGEKVGSQTGKFIEVLNPEQTDEFGAAQVTSGDNTFGKPTPTTTYKVKEGITYGRQRQIVKKGESLYSLRKDPVTGEVTVEAMPGRSNKDKADFYALAESARQIENYSPGDKAKLGKLLEEFKISQKTDDFDVDEYLKNNAISKTKEDPVTLTVGTSLLQKTQQKAGAIAAYTTTPGVQSYRFIPKVKQESATKNSVPSASRVSRKTNTLSQPNVSLSTSGSLVTSRTSTSGSLMASTSRTSTSRTSTSRPSTSRTSTSLPSTSLPSISRPSTSRPSTSRPSTSRPSTSRPGRSRPSGPRSSSSSSGSIVNQVPITSRRKAIGGWVNVVEGEKKNKTTKNKKTKDFIGNTRLDNIVGLFKRREIISGDKASAKQLKRDKRFKEGGKKRKHKAKNPFGQRIGVIEKGFKI